MPMDINAGAGPNPQLRLAETPENSATDSPFPGVYGLEDWPRAVRGLRDLFGAIETRLAVSIFNLHEPIKW